MQINQSEIDRKAKIHSQMNTISYLIHENETVHKKIRIKREKAEQNCGKNNIDSV